MSRRSGPKYLPGACRFDFFFIISTCLPSINCTVSKIISQSKQGGQKERSLNLHLVSNSVPHSDPHKEGSDFGPVSRWFAR